MKNSTRFLLFTCFKATLANDFLLLVERLKKSAHKFYYKELVYKKPFSYRVVHHMLLQFFTTYDT